MFRRLKMVLAWPLYSANSVSTYAMLVFLLAVHQRYFFLTCSSSMLAARGSPSEILAIIVVLTMFVGLCGGKEEGIEQKIYRETQMY